MKGKELTRPGRKKITGNTEPIGVGPHFRVAPAAESRAQVPGIVVEGAATKHVSLTVLLIAGRAIGGGVFVVVGKMTVLHPLPHVAMHVVKAERVRLEGANGSRMFVLPLTATTSAISVALAGLITP